MIIFLAESRIDTLWLEYKRILKAVEYPNLAQHSSKIPIGYIYYCLQAPPLKEVMPEESESSIQRDCERENFLSLRRRSPACSRCKKD